MRLEKVNRIQTGELVSHYIEWKKSSNRRDKLIMIQAMFLIRTDFSERSIVFCFKQSFFHISGYTNVRCIQWWKNHWIILKTNRVISGIFRGIEFVLIRSNVPNKNRLCKIHRKTDFLLNGPFCYVNLEISLCLLHKKSFLIDGRLTFSGWRQTYLCYEVSNNINICVG